MLHHIELCLDEIECEVEFHLASSMSALERQELKSKIDELRAFVGALASAAHHTSVAGITADKPATEIIADQAIASADAPITAATPIAELRDDDLTMIRGIDASTAAALRAKGVTTFAAIADWRADDVLANAVEGISTRRIAQQCWIEQAAILATGQLTDYARRLQRGELAALVAMPEPVTFAEADTTWQADTMTAGKAITIGAIEINAEKSNFLPPVFEAVAPAAKPAIVAAPAIGSVGEVVNEAADLATAACDAAEASARNEVVALTKMPTPAAKAGWVGRMSLAASLILLLSVGILGIESKLPVAASLLHVVSAD
ncbi:MAG: hypothetical protein ACK4MF_10735 [Hyphomicrobiaceae bacterium]